MKADDEKSPVLTSLTLLVANLLSYAAATCYVLITRRPIRQRMEDADIERLPLPAQLFLTAPGTIVAAAVLVYLVMLIVKEVAIERRELTLRLNLLSLAIVGVLFATYVILVQKPHAPP